jgi:shikimate kinase
MAKIFITGYMGSGKSTAGKKLAADLGYEFIDLDHFIEAQYKMSIPEIFASKGESEFRSIEHNSLKKVLEKTNTVISCGGGTPCYFNNMELMNNNGITIYLKMSVDALVHRLIHAKEKRPLIMGKTETELHAFITRQLEKREDFYDQAQFTVKGKNLKIEELVAFIKQQAIKEA